MTTRLTLDAFLRACPRELIAEHHKSDRRIDLVNGSRVYFGSADKPGSLEGTNLAWAWVDEARLISAESWRVIVGRVRDRKARLPQIIVTTTPAMGWLEEEWNSGRPGRVAFHGSTVENEKNLRPGFIDELRRTYSPRLAKSLIDGEFSVLSGAVYEEFDEGVHVVDWKFDPRLPLWLSWDFGVRAASILFAQMTGDFPCRLPDGRVLPPHSVVIFDEVQTEGPPTLHQIPRVQRRLVEIGKAAGLPGAPPLHRIVCDPAGNQRSQDTGMQNVALLQQPEPAGFGHIVRWEDDMSQRYIRGRIERVCGALRPVDGEPTLYLARSLLHPDDPVAKRRGIAKAIKGSTYPERKGRKTPDLPEENEYEHARDTLEYLVIRAQNETRRPMTTHRPALKFGHR